MDKTTSQVADLASAIDAALESVGLHLSTCTIQIERNTPQQSYGGPMRVVASIRAVHYQGKDASDGDVRTALATLGLKVTRHYSEQGGMTPARIVVINAEPA